MLTFDTTLGHFLCRLQNQSLSFFVFLSFSPILVAGLYLWWFKLHFSSFRTHLDVASWAGGGSGVEMRDSEHWKTRAPFHLLSPSLNPPHRDMYCLTAANRKNICEFFECSATVSPRNQILGLWYESMCWKPVTQNSVVDKYANTLSVLMNNDMDRHINSISTNASQYG